MRHVTWFPRSLFAIAVALLVAASLGGMVAIALAASEAPSFPRTQVSASLSAVNPATSLPWIDPELTAHLEAQDDAPVRIIVALDTPSVDPVERLSVASAATLAQARTTFVAEKQVRFTQAVRAIEPVFDAARERDLLGERRDLWLVDAVALTAHPALVRELATLPGVAEVHLDHYRQYVDPPTDLLGMDFARDIAPDRGRPTGASPRTVAQDAEVYMLDAGERPWGLDEVRAPEVWHTLGVSGTGAVVAVVDTGVDWQHPDLIDGYRGNVGSGIFLHDVAWHDAVNDGVYPYDDHGHGTHVIGTAAGGTTGVAPGAQWIGVKVLSGDGYGYDSWILDGLQWLLAPGGDPALAPDIVNCSWSSSLSSATPFLSAIQALEAAGVLPVFATGNLGPEAGSVGSPASNPGVFGVGAADPDRDVPGFSGRGPSPWDEVKPLVVAPGVNVVSAAPGGTYQSKSGTSMATPHVAGLGALMRGVSPTLPVAEMAAIITRTSRPLTAPVPNNDSGWGLIDAFEAMVLLTDPAMITGTVTDAHGQGLPGATVTAWPEAAVPGVGPGSVVETDAQGRYTLALPSGRYVMQAGAFGYWPATEAPVIAISGDPTRVDFALTGIPTGQVSGSVTVLGSTLAPTTEVRVRALDTSVASDVGSGTYNLTLPQGIYTLEVRGLGYRVVTGTVEIVAAGMQSNDFILEPAPTLLLVDEGAWYYGSRIGYWTDALDGARYAYDQVRIKTPLADTPVSTTLMGYDVVLWSSPLGSPGLVGAGSALTDYLGYGGRLLLSGQDVAYLDGGGLAFWGRIEPYLWDHMSVGFVAEQGEQPVAIGEGVFEGLTVTLVGGSGADNQVGPDVVAVRDPEAASAVWRYGGGEVGGVAAEVCTPHRSLHLGFGLEGVADAADRRNVLSRGIDWLITEPPTTGLRISRLTNLSQVGSPGETVTHVVSLRHIGARGVTETIAVVADGAAWPTLVSPAVFTLSPCTSVSVTVTVSIPLGTGTNEADAITFTATSDKNTTPVTVSLLSKTPAPVLLVDDDRWYPQEQRYIDALTAAGIPFDLWDTGSSRSRPADRYSPDGPTLSRYPIVVWFTGYDWYAPLVDIEIERLQSYLDQGGKLLLSSQDYAYHHEDSALSERLGILLADWTDAVTEARPVAEHPAGGLWPPVALEYPFSNWSHTTEPAPGASPVIRGQLGQPAGIGVAADHAPGGKTLFYSFPLEALPLEARGAALSNGVGWLSPLGGSDWSVTPTVGAPGDPVTFNLMLRNSEPATITAAFAHVVPADFTVAPGQLPPGVDYSAATGEITWLGPIEPEGEIAFAWPAVWQGAPQPTGAPTVTLSLPAWGLRTSRTAPFYGRGPDLAASAWFTAGLAGARPAETISVTYVLQNNSGVTASDVTLSYWMMRGLGPITATTPLTGGIEFSAWHGDLPPGVWMHALEMQGEAWGVPLRLDALVEDGMGHRWEEVLWLTLDPWQSYLPVVTRS